METQLERPTQVDRRCLGSVVIPAYNESAVIRQCLDALFTGVDPWDLDVVVVSNGCTDDTAEIARASGHPIRVLELAQGSKPKALSAGDEVALCGPRLYLDADVRLSGEGAMKLLDRLGSGSLAVRPPVEYDSARSSWLVRSYYRARARLPTVDAALWGAHVYGLSQAGRSRFGAFPEVLGDDLWVDRQFGREEIEIVDCAPIRIPTPARAWDLVYVLRRHYRSCKEDELPTYQPTDPPPPTAPSMLADLRRLAASGPGSALDAIVYCAFALAGRVARVLRRSNIRWERDDSARG
jgi:hypothetical protein